MGRTPRRSLARTATWFLLAAACQRETRETASAAAAIFGVADSVVFELAGETAGGDSIVTVRTRTTGDSLVAVVTTPRGGIAFFDRRGQLVDRVDRADVPPRPIGPILAAADCAHGGLLLVTGGDRRVLSFDSAGAMVTRWRFPSSVGALLGVQCESPDDVLALADGEMPPIKMPSLVRVGSVLYRFAGRGTNVDTLGAFPGRELLRLSSADPGQVPPFGVFSRFAAGPTRLYVASSDQAAIEQLQVNGRTLGSITFVSDDDRVSRAAVDSALRAHLAARHASWPEAAFRGMAAVLAKNRQEAPWAAFAIDPDENVWVATNEAPNEGDRLWFVFGPDGLRRAKGWVPYDFEVTEVGRTYILGFHRAEPARRAARMYGLRLMQ
jgi:hypothetical protein